MNNKEILNKYLAVQKKWITKYLASKQFHLIENNKQNWIVDRVIVDVGCGNGVLEALYKSMASDFISTDIIDQNIFGINVNISSAESLPFQDNRFDTVFLVGVIEHIEDKQKALSECCRILKSGGKLIVVIPTGIFWKLVKCLPYKKQSIREHSLFGKKDLLSLLPNRMVCKNKFSVIPFMFSMFEFDK